VTSFLPTTGPVSGATVVTVTGTGFLPRYLLQCRFGTQRVSATYGSGSILRCLSPASGGSATGTVVLEVSNNNADLVVDFTTDAVLFTFQGK
jgi:hypothetical protein